MGSDSWFAQSVSHVGERTQTYQLLGGRGMTTALGTGTLQRDKLLVVEDALKCLTALREQAAL